MTQLPQPPSPNQRRQWAQELLKVFSQPENQFAPGAHQLRAAARKILRTYDPGVPIPGGANHLDPWKNRQLELFQDNRGKERPTRSKRLRQLRQ
jgi:hypothetical protein